MFGQYGVRWRHRTTRKGRAATIQASHWTSQVIKIKFFKQDVHVNHGVILERYGIEIARSEAAKNTSKLFMQNRTGPTTGKRFSQTAALSFVIS